MPLLLDNLEVYNLSLQLSNKIWDEVYKWESFVKFGLGRQLTNAADSVSANIAEGYGRYFIKENINFCFYARGSALETKDWLQKAHARNLIAEHKYVSLQKELEIIHLKLNAYIRVLRANIKKQQ